MQIMYMPKEIIDILKNEIQGINHGSNAQSNPLLLGDVFENFSNACLKIYEFDPDHFLHQGYPGKQPLKMQK